MSDIVEILKAELRRVNLERARIMNALQAYESITESDSYSADGASLDDFTVKDAAHELLKRAWDQGRESLSVLEIEAKLRHYKLKSSRKNLSGSYAASEAQIPRLLMRALTAPGNRGIFRREGTSGSKHVRPSDRVSLANPPMRKKEEA